MATSQREVLPGFGDGQHVHRSPVGVIVFTRVRPDMWSVMLVGKGGTTTIRSGVREDDTVRVADEMLAGA